MGSELVIGALIGLLAGGGVTFFIQSVVLKKRREHAASKKPTLEGEAMKKDKILASQRAFP